MLHVVNNYAEQESDCLRAKVGVAMCTGTHDDLIMRYLAHNGQVNNRKCSGEQGQCGCFHAEIRVIMKVWKEVSSFGAEVTKEGMKGFENWNWIIVCKWTPCTTCANFILQYGDFISEWYYEYEYRNPRGMHILREAGIKCQKI